MRLVAFILAALLGLAPCPLMAAVHSLVVGIDNYENHSPLKGAVNDARDVSAAMEHLATGERITLIDRQATRAGFLSAWGKVSGASKSGDLILLHFSGHGIQFTDDNGDEEDGLDEFFAFQPFSEDGSNFDEKIRDDELADLFSQQKRKGVTVLLVADTCHSGGLTRSLGAPVGGLPYRLIRFNKRKSPPAPRPADFKAREEMPDNVVFLAATHEKRRVQEMLLGHDLKPRGALSYYFSRAVEGRADKNRDKSLTAGELIGYLQTIVSEKSNSRQLPFMKAKNPRQRLLQVVPASDDVAFPQLASLNVAVSNSSETPSIKGANLVTDVSQAELIWDPAKSSAHNESSDALAHNIAGTDLQTVVDSRRVRNALIDVMKNGNPLSIGLSPDDRLHSQGCQVTVHVDRFDHRHFTIVDLNGNGTVQFLYPTQPGDPLKWDSNDPWKISFAVSPPFGADFVIFIASDQPLQGLHQALNGITNRTAPLELYDALREHLEGKEIQLGVKGIYTARKGEPCGA